MLQEMKRWIDEHHLLPGGSHVMVGVSGGADSLALLHGLKELAHDYQWRLTAIHVEHGLRGAESEADAQFVVQTAKRWGIAVFVEHVDVKGALREQGGNKQELARKMRYDAFARIAKQQAVDVLALAHQADDQVETVLMRILRGTSPAGLVGIPLLRPWRDIQLVRPLLGVSREAIEAYCLENGLTPREDASNQDIQFTRNRVRLELLPMLATYNPRVRDSILQLSKLAQAESLHWQVLEEQARAEVVVSERDGWITLDIQRLTALDIALQRRVIKLILNCLVKKETNLSTHQAVEGIRSVIIGSNPAASLHLPGEMKAEREYGWLHLFRKSQERSIPYYPPFSSPLPLQIPGRTELPQGTFRAWTSTQPVSVEHGMDYAVFDREQLQGALTVRSRRPGDRMWPKGLHGRKKVKDILIDAKVPKRERDSIPFVFHGDEIIWIPGLVHSQWAPVDQDTKTYLTLSWKWSS
ncbi:tRNA lysidine(34) synthetase TilS [Marininema halotolerans]|uniref:tRNA lysidine(34) synthetase TilS n=1 Tax=Marininema halotolerans TaxID=1155944 RepID=UPI001595F129|nr:tRNA lysidine(34) synthetase TilS [Marininema halotolerans]